MRAFKWLFLFVVWSLIAAFFHYQLPRTDVVRVVGTEVRRVDVGETPWFWSDRPSAVEALPTRDVSFIQAIESDGSPRVYRNEDTGWGWPPYFKFESENLQAGAANLISTREAPQWVAVRHYGWRVPVLSIFPNALAVRPVEGPEVRTIPWTAIIVLILFAAVFWAIYVRWRRLRDAYVYPRVEGVEASWEERRARRAARRRERREAQSGP